MPFLDPFDLPASTKGVVKYPDFDPFLVPVLSMPVDQTVSKTLILGASRARARAEIPR